MAEGSKNLWKKIIERACSSEKFIIGAIVLTITLVLYKQYIWGSRLLIFSDIGSDTYYAYYPLDTYYGKLLADLDFSFWSFKPALGAGLNWIPELTNPLVLFQNLIGFENISHMYVWRALLSSILAALAWNYYLKIFQLKKSTNILFSVLYGANGYLILWGQHLQSQYPLILFPIILRAIDELVRADKFTIKYPIALALLGISNYYFAFCFSVYSIVFFLWRLFTHIKQSKKLLKISFRFIVLSIIGICLASPALLPAYLQVASSTRLGNTYPNIGFSMTDYMSFVGRAFSNNMLGFPTIGFHGRTNYYEAPVLYCGIITLILGLIAAFLHKGRRMWIDLAFITASLWLVLSYTSGLFFIGFAKPATTRHSFIFILSFLTLAASSFETLQNQSSRAKVSTTVVCTFLIALLASCYIFFSKNTSNSILNYHYAVALVCIIAYWVIFTRSEIGRLSYSLIFFMVIFEIIFSNYPTLNARGTLWKNRIHTKAAHLRYSSARITDYIKDQKENGFYRVFNQTTTAVNDPLLNDYAGLTAYLSVVNKSNIDIPTNLKITDGRKGNKHILGPKNRPLLAALLGTRFIITNAPLENKKPIMEDEQWQLYENMYYAPLAFTYTQCFSELPSKDNSQNDILLFDALYSPICKDLNISELTNNRLEELLGDKDLSKRIIKLKKHQLNHLQIGSDKITGTINIPEPSILFFSIPFNKGWSVEVNDKLVRPIPINGGFIGVPIIGGRNKISLKYSLPGLHAGLMIALAALVILVLLRSSRFSRRLFPSSFWSEK